MKKVRRLQVDAIRVGRRGDAGDGLRAGAVPPFGSCFGLRTFVDSRCASKATPSTSMRACAPFR